MKRQENTEIVGDRFSGGFLLGFVIPMSIEPHFDFPFLVDFTSPRTISFVFYKPQILHIPITLSKSPQVPNDDFVLCIITFASYLEI